MILNFSKEQKVISDFLYYMYRESDSVELDLWIAYLARHAGDEQLAIAIEGGEYDAN